MFQRGKINMLLIVVRRNRDQFHSQVPPSSLFRDAKGDLPQKRRTRIRQIAGTGKKIVHNPVFPGNLRDKGSPSTLPYQTAVADQFRHNSVDRHARNTELPAKFRFTRETLSWTHRVQTLPQFHGYFLMLSHR